jgi:salicylate hydroxylase
MLRVAIVGGGIGGLVLALALRRRGIACEVYEQARELREVGAAVALSANATRELRRLGLGEQVEAVSVVPSALVIRRWDTGDTSATADVVVGADGVHSVIRPHVAGAVRGRYSGTVGYRGLVPVEAMPSLPDPTPLQFWAGPGRHLLHYAIDGGRTVNFLAVVRVPQWTSDTWMEECAVSDAVDAFAGWHPAVTEMVGATDVGARWALHDLAPFKRWHTDRAVLMGDAAHAMVPHQGQGANQTIEDAVTLADALADIGDLGAALRAYSARRRKRAVAVQWASRRTADLMHLPDGPEIAMRDASFGDLYSGLAWIHSHDAHADRPEPPRVRSADARTSV